MCWKKIKGRIAIKVVSVKIQKIEDKKRRN